MNQTFVFKMMDPPYMLISCRRLFRNKALLKILARNLKHPKDGTNTARGIQKVRDMMRAEGRPFAPKIMIVITDGRSMNPAKTIAQANLAKVRH